MLQDSPEIITSKFGNWLELFGITNIPVWMHSQWFNDWLISACFLWLVFSTINYFRPKPQPIRPIKLEEAADYLTNKSLWGLSREYDFRYFSREEHAIAEIVNKARLGLITIKGRIPNSCTAKELGKHYWKGATLGYFGSYLFTNPNVMSRGFDFITYGSLEITSPDIKRVWKPSSRLDRFFYKQYV